MARHELLKWPSLDATPYFPPVSSAALLQTKTSAATPTTDNLILACLHAWIELKMFPGSLVASEEKRTRICGYEHASEKRSSQSLIGDGSHLSMTIGWD